MAGDAFDMRELEEARPEAVAEVCERLAPQLCRRRVSKRCQIRWRCDYNLIIYSSSRQPYDS
jgi:hypothetical protein